MLDACSGQLLRAGMDGAPTGLDLAACLALAGAKGYDIGIVADLLPAAEEGMLEGVAKLRSGRE